MPNATGPQAPQAVHVVAGVEAGLADGIPGRLCCQEVAEAGEGHCLLKAWARPVGATMRALEGQQDTAPNMSPGPPDHCWSVAG